MPILSGVEGCRQISRVLDEMFHVELPTDLCERLSRFHENVMEWNAYAGLVSSHSTLDDLWGHTLDSLSLAPYVKAAGQPISSHWDVGSGGGFPGIVLALALPELRITLVERNAKKFTFLERQVRELELLNVTAIETPFPASAPRGAFSMTARAIEKPLEFVASLESAWHDGSIFLSQFTDSPSRFAEGWKHERVQDALDEFRRGDLFLIRR